MRQKHFAEAARLLSLPGRMSPVNEKGLNATQVCHEDTTASPELSSPIFR